MDRLTNYNLAGIHADHMEALDALARAQDAMPLFVTVPAPALSDGHVDALEVREQAA